MQNVEQATIRRQVVYLWRWNILLNQSTEICHTWKVLHIYQMTTFRIAKNAQVGNEFAIQKYFIWYIPLNSSHTMSDQCPDSRFSFFSHSFDSDRKIECKIISIWNDLYGAIKCAPKQAINIESKLKCPRTGMTLKTALDRQREREMEKTIHFVAQT